MGLQPLGLYVGLKQLEAAWKYLMLLLAKEVIVRRKKINTSNKTTFRNGLYKKQKVVASQNLKIYKLKTLHFN